jgi:hypothetical protein
VPDDAVQGTLGGAEAEVDRAIKTIEGTRRQLADFKEENQKQFASLTGPRQFADIDALAKSLRSFESTWLLLSRWRTELEERLTSRTS